MKGWLTGLILGLALRASAEIPVDAPIDEPSANGPGRGIFVPDPLRSAVVSNGPAINMGDEPQKPMAPTFATGLKLMPSPVRRTDLVKLRGSNEEWAGKLVECDGTSLVWSAAIATNLVRFPGDRVADLWLADPAAPAVPLPRWIVKLTNGDVLTGDRLTMDTNHVALVAGPTHRYRIARAFVAAVHQDIAPAEDTFRGLQWPAHWDRIEPQENGGIYRDLGLPDRFMIEFPYFLSRTPAEDAGLRIGVFAPRPELLDTVLSCGVVLKGQRLEHYMSAAGGSEVLGEKPVKLGSARMRPWVEIGLQVDRLARRIVFTVDGDPRAACDMKRLPETCGRGVMIQGLGAGRRLPPWMLFTPLGEGDSGFSASKTQDTILFANGAVMAGTLESIGATNVVVEGSLGRIRLPIARLRAANLSLSGGKEIPPRAGDVAIELRGGGQLTGGLKRLSTGGAVVDSAWGGDVSLPFAAVASVHWRPHPQSDDWLPTECGTPGKEPSGAAGSVVQLTDGRWMEGGLAGFDANAVHWRYPGVREALALRREKIAWMRWVPSPQAAAPEAGVGAEDAPAGTMRWPEAAEARWPGVLQLSDGQQLQGTLAGFDANFVHWRYPAAMEVSALRCDQVASIRWDPNPQGAAVAQAGSVTNNVRAGGAWWYGLVQLTDGRQLRGSLAGFDADAVYWRHPAVEEAVVLRREKVVWGATGQPPMSQVVAPVTVELAGGDQISGHVLGLDGEGLRVQPLWGGTVSVARAQVARLRPAVTPENVLDSGGSAHWAITARPSGSDEASQMENITVTNGIVSLPQHSWGSSYARQGDWPGRLCVQFDLCGPDVKRELQVHAFGRGSTNMPNEGMCMLILSGGGARLQLFRMNHPKPDHFVNDMQDVKLGDRRGRWTMNAVWLLDRERREMFFVLDGKVVLSLKGRASFPGGNRISLWGYDEMQSQVRRIVLSEWRGDAGLFAQAAPADADMVWRHDMTCVTGTVSRIADGRIFVASGAGGEAGVPMAQVSWIDFRASGEQPVKVSPGDVRILMLDGDRVLLSSARYERGGEAGQDRVVGTSSIMGTVAVPASAIWSVDFRPREGR